MDSGDDRDSMAAGGRSDGGDDLPSDLEGMQDEPGSPERGTPHGHGVRLTRTITGQEDFLARELGGGGAAWWEWEAVSQRCCLLARLLLAAACLMACQSEHTRSREPHPRMP